MSSTVRLMHTFKDHLMPQYTNSTSQTALTFPYQAAKFQQKKKTKYGSFAGPADLNPQRILKH